MKYHFFEQINSWDCGLACIFMIIKFYQKRNKLNYQQFFNKNNYFQNLTLLQIKEIGRKFGIALIGFQTQWSEFKKYKIKKPIICQIKKYNQFHFIVIYKEKKNKYLVADPLKKELEWIDKEKISKLFSGIIALTDKWNELSVETNKERFWYWNKNFIWGNLLGLGIVFIINILRILNQFLIKILIDDFLLIKTNSLLIQVFIGMMILIITEIFLYTIENFLLLRLSQKFYQKWHFRFLYRLFNLSFLEFRKYRKNDLFIKYQKFQEILLFYFPIGFQIGSKIIDLLIIFSIISYFSIIFGNNILIFIFLIITLNGFIHWILIPDLQKREKEKLKANQTLQKKILNLFDYFLDNKNRNQETINQKEILFLYEKQKIINVKENTWTHYFWIINKVLFGLTMILTIYNLIYIQNKILTLGMFILLFNLILNFIQKSNNFFRYFWYWNKIKRLKEEINPFLFGKKISKTLNLIPNQLNSSNFFEINLKNFNFTFGTKTNLWKKNLNFKLYKDTFLFGNSGKGKTTILNIIKGNWKEYRGEIIINKDFNLKILNSKWWKEQVYFLQSDSVLMQKTIFENIFTVKIDEKDWKIWKEKKLDSFLKQINLNLKDYVHPGQLSKGQIQIINFLKLFFLKEKILLLDEVLNSVPQKLKKDLITLLLETLNNKIIIYTSHDQKLNLIFSQKWCLN